MNIFNIGTEAYSLTALKAFEIDSKCLAKDCWTLDQWNELFSIPYYDFFYDSSEGILSSFALFSHIPGNSYVDLLKIGTCPSLERKGFAQVLLTNTLKEYKARAVDTVFLEVRLDNQKAIAFYVKMGFQEDNLLRAYYSDGADGLRMRLIV